MDEYARPRLGVTGEHATDGIPHGSTSLIPFLAIKGAADATELLRSVLGARVVDITRISGIVVHAELDVGDGRLQLGEPSPDSRLVPAPRGDGDCHSIGLPLADVDAIVQRAEQVGATTREPVGTFVSGDRFASIRDPFGVRWSVMSRVEDLSQAQSARRVAESAATQQTSSDQ